MQDCANNYIANGLEMCDEMIELAKIFDLTGKTIYIYIYIYI